MARVGRWNVHTAHDMLLWLGCILDDFPTADSGLLHRPWILSSKGR